MTTLEAKSAGYIWKKACELVLKKGKKVYDGDVLLKEVLDLFIVVENATVKDLILRKYADPKMINWMVSENFGGTKPVLDWGYCYGMRLKNYCGINQIKEIISKLRKNPESKSATISTMKPDEDFKGHMPCITTLDFKIREKKLHLTAFFRSQDIGKKFYADILSLGAIQEEISKVLKIPNGKVKIFISSAHIYETDLENVYKFLNNTN